MKSVLLSHEEGVKKKKEKKRKKKIIRNKYLNEWEGRGGGGKVHGIPGSHYPHP